MSELLFIFCWHLLRTEARFLLQIAKYVFRESAEELSMSRGDSILQGFKLYPFSVVEKRREITFSNQESAGVCQQKWNNLKPDSWELDENLTI